MIAWLLGEIRRQRRGWQALRDTFGPTFTGAMAFVMGLLLVALWAHNGIPIVVLAGLLLLLAVRAHDLGDVEDGEPTELDSTWSDQREREDAFLASQLEEAKAREAAATFLRDRHSAALGPPHDGQEL